MGLALAVLAISRWLRAAPPLRRLLLPTLAGGVTALILVIQIYYDVITGEFIRSSQQITAVLLVSVPLAFLFGMLHQQLARAGMADLVVALQRAPGSRRLGEALSKALGDPSLVLAYWLPRFDSYVDAEGAPVALPEEGSGRATTFVDNDGHHIAALVHDPALAHQPDLLEVVCAAANVALERERLQTELEARVVELQASRERIVTAGDAERRRLERNLHDGAQQRLVAIALQLSLLKGRIQSDPATAEQLAKTAGDELALSLAELRELARGIHPAVLEHGLAAALDSLAARAMVPTKVMFETVRAPPRARRARGLLRGLRGAGQRRQVRQRDHRLDARLAQRSHRQHRDRRRRDRRSERRRRLGAARPRRSRRGAGGPAARLQPRRRRHGGHRRAALRGLTADGSGVELDDGVRLALGHDLVAAVHVDRVAIADVEDRVHGLAVDILLADAVSQSVPPRRQLRL